MLGKKARWKVGTALLLTATLSWITACGPAALEEKRLADQCHAVFGFDTPEARACLETAADRLAMHEP